MFYVLFSRFFEEKEAILENSSLKGNLEKLWKLWD
jgi:hypothetical protein